MVTLHILALLKKKNKKTPKIFGWVFFLHEVKLAESDLKFINSSCKHIFLSLYNC